MIPILSRIFSFFESETVVKESVLKQPFIKVINDVAVSPAQNPNLNLKKVSGLPREIKKIVFDNLLIKDLNALELAVSTKAEQGILVKDLCHVRAKKILEEMLESFHKPVPIDFNSWPELSDDEKIWLLGLFQLQELGVDFSYAPLEINCDKWARKHLLERKSQIDDFLNSIHTLDVQRFQFVKNRKFPDAIHFLKNLKEVNLFGSQAPYRPGFSCPIQPWTYCKSAKIFEREKIAYEEALKDYHFYRAKMHQYPKIRFL